ncbi:MAG: hypothetical protein ACRETL_00530, partial [Gammaproteobacteria bacterium]
MVLALASCGGGGDGASSGSGSASSPSAAAAQTLGSKTFPRTCISTGSSADTNNTYGSFTVSSNIWNRGAASAFTQCTGATIQSPGGVTAAEFDWNFTSTSGSVLTYPNLQFGQQSSYSPSTTSILPAPISALPSLTATGTITTTCTAAPCYYDSGFDIFFSSGAGSSKNIQGELMIITSYNFSQTLNGSWTATNVSIGGATYNIRQFTMGSGSNSWPYVAYYATSPITQMNLNIN